MIHTAAGYYTPVTPPAWAGSPSYAHIWYLRDHLGNNRVLADGSGNAVAFHDYDPYGEEIAMASSSQPYPLPPGAKDSPYLYGGKEWSETTSTYDFEARYLSPSFHRFTTMDPLAEKYYSISPYAYCAGDPVNLVDPEGTTTGDYYSYWGYYVGNDGLVDGKVFLVDDLTITNYLSIDQRYASFEENYFTLSEGAFEVDGLIVVEREDEDEYHTQGEFNAIGANGFSGYTMERPGPPTTIPNLKKPIPKGFYETKPLTDDFAGGFAFQIFNPDVPERRKIYGHVGNTPRDSSGCVLFGMGIGERNASITNSRKAMSHFRAFYNGKNNVKMIVR